MPAVRSGLAPLAAFLLLLLAGSARAAEPKTPPTKEQIAKAIEDLSDENFGVRQKAVAFLKSGGRAVEPALKKVLAGQPTLEVRRRVENILDEFKWGIYPDTPTRVLDQIKRYRAGDPNIKRAVVADLTRLGGHGYGTLLKLATAEEDANLRGEWLHFLANDTDRAIPVLLADGNEVVVEDMLELGLTTEREPALRNYAAYMLLRKRLDEKIDEIKDRAANGDKKLAHLLAHLYRAKGMLPAAREMAEKADKQVFVDQILTEAGDWKALAKRALNPARPMNEEEKLGYLAAYRRLSTPDADLDKAIADLVKLGSNENGNVGLAAKALFLNDRTVEGLALLKEKKLYLPAFEVLCAQLKYREGLDFIKNVKSDELEPALALELRRAQVLHHLGEKEEAIKQLLKIAADHKDGENFFTYRDIVRAEMRLGLRDQALMHAAHVLTGARNEERAPQILVVLFPGKGDSAEVWWKFLRRKTPEGPALPVLQRLRDIVEARTADAGYLDLLRDAERSAVGLPLMERGPWMLGLAETALSVGQDELGQNFLEKAVLLAESPAAIIRLGDVLVARKEWKQAAERYRQAWELDRTQPLPLHLSGWSLAQAGQAGEGRKLMDLAHVIPMANEQTRYAFAQGLAQRGHREEAWRERNFILAVGSDEGWHSNETVRHIAYDLMARKDYAKAAESFERFRLRCLRASTSFVEYGAYIHVPVLIHQNNARALLAAGKLDEAGKPMRHCVTVLPGNLSLPIQLVSDLEKKGRKDEADTLFKQTFALHVKLSEDFPKSATLHNSVAWLAVGCRRNLDEALTHSRKAAELVPTETGFLDTLAEVHFQRGEKDEAIKVMKRCLELEPRNEYYRKQLKRIEAGDPKAEVPEGGA